MDQKMRVGEPASRFRKSTPFESARQSGRGAVGRADNWGNRQRVRLVRIEGRQDALPYQEPIARWGVSSGDEAAQPGRGDNQLALRQLKQDRKHALLRQAVAGGVISGDPGYDQIGSRRAADWHVAAIVRG